MEHLDLPASASAAGTGRALVEGYCARHHLTARATADAVLMTSELLTNAYLHARSPMVLTLEVVGPALRVAVADQSAAAPVRGRPGADSTGGRGLLLLDQLAERWGVLSQPPGKAVWFELTLAVRGS